MLSASMGFSFIALFYYKHYDYYDVCVCMSCIQIKTDRNGRKKANETIEIQYAL